MAGGFHSPPFYIYKQKEKHDPPRDFIFKKPHIIMKKEIL